ncbi:sterol desaturase family protein [Pseudorhodoferax sp. Leaf267]|uniref:sterol desaturase family protein n=1 Tax=Pseudorhodoferax sp. Leaf267 TaxID=1736316 RepID=UPI0006F8C557|nr:sterol desaturase family protein [Pseudorhodoferax sp. Leaf267]KQP17870.1 fatty acid hydroxylase [Pseudorhodoferax sp. Leaf267]
MDALTDLFGNAQQWLFENAVQPLAFALGLGGRLEEAFVGTGWLLVGLLQIVVMLLVIGPLQRLRPVEPVRDAAAIRTDVVYTLVHRLGLFRLALFFTLEPWMDDVFGWLRVAGLSTFHLDALWPGVTDLALVSFLLYLVVFDFVDYWIHRGQHQWRWWWSLHALHHSQRQMTMWSDNRNHLLDDVLRDLILVVIAQTIGVGPGQFVAIVALTQLSENFHHANLRVWFGAVGERLWVSPRFHRRHHSIGIGHESTGRDTLGGCNFGVLLPWWDMLFGTSDFQLRYDPTGIRDQVEQGPRGLRDYGRGFWSQQWLGLLRLLNRA